MSKAANGAYVQVEDTKICVVMVGLPARGKSLIAGKGVLSPSLSQIHSAPPNPTK
jgi:6-phosphofructo-2-kinase